MGARFIYFNRELDQKLEKVENVSGLISQLLEKFFTSEENKNNSIDIESIKTFFNKSRDDKIKNQREKVISSLTRIKKRDPTEKEIEDSLEFLKKCEEKKKGIIQE
jgi:hypothetical protein